MSSFPIPCVQFCENLRLRGRRSSAVYPVEIRIPPRVSESVLRIGILVPCLVIMAGFAKALPVVLVPKKNRVTTVRFYMIDHRCFHCHSFFIALHTQRMQTKISLPCFLPSASVPALPAAHPVTAVVYFMFLTIISVRQLRASGMMAWLLWFHRHIDRLPSMYRGGVKGLESRQPRA